MATSSIKTVMQMDETDVTKKLKAIEKLYKTTYGDWADSIGEVDNATKKLDKAQIDLAESLASLKKEKAKGSSSNKDTIVELEQEIASRKQVVAELTREKRVSKEARTGRKDELSQLKQIRTESIANIKTQKDYTKVQKDHTKATTAQAKSYKNLANQTIRYMRWLGTIAGAIYAVNKAWKLTLGTGIDINKMMEANANGIAALTSANTRMADSFGNILTPMQKFAMGHKIATEVLKDLRKESLKTPATFKELTEIYQQATGQTLAMGNAFGATVEDINKNTVLLSKRFSIVANAIGQPMDRVKEEIRSALTGNVSTDSIISTMIFGSPTEANESIKLARERFNGLKDLFDEKLGVFDILSEKESFTKSVLAMRGAWEIAMSDMVEKSGMFKDLTETFYTVADSIVESTDGIVGRFDSIYSSIKNIGSTLAMLEVPAKTIASVWALTAAVKALSAASKLNPFILAGTAVAAGSYSIADYLADEEKKVKEVTKLLAQSTKDYEDQTQGWLERKSKALKASLGALEDDLSKTKDNLSMLGEDFNVDASPQVKAQQQLIDQLQARIVLIKPLIDSKKEEMALADKEIEKIAAKAKLITKLTINETVQGDIASFIKKEESALSKLHKQKIEWQKDLLINEEKLRAEEERKIPIAITLAKLDEVIAANKQGIQETTQKIEELNEKTTLKKLKHEIKIQELKEEELNLRKQIAGEAVLESDNLANRLNSALKIADLTKGEAAHIEAINKALKLQYELNQKLKEEADPKKQEKTDTTYYDVMSDSYKTMLNQQLELTNSTLSWIDGLQGASSEMGNIASAIVNISKIDTETKIKSNKLNEKFTKDWVKLYDKDKDRTKLEEDHAENTAKAKIQRNEAELAGYSNLAGVMAETYEKGTAGAILFTAAQSALGITSAWTAIAQAWSLGFPYNLGAVAIVTAGVMPILDQLGAKGSGGGGTASIPNAAVGEATTFTELNQNADYNTSFEDFEDGLKGATEALEQFANEGTARSTTLESLQAQIAKRETKAIELQEIVNTINSTNTSDLQREEMLATYGYDGLKDYKDLVEQDIDGYKDEINSLLTEVLSDALDFDTYSYAELKDITGIDDISKFNKDYEALARELGDISTEVKKMQRDGVSTQVDIDAFIEASRATEIIGSNTMKTMEDYRDAAEAMTDILKERAEELEALNERMMNLRGTSFEILNYNRNKELEATDDSNKALLKSIYAEEDRQKALEEATQAQEDNYQAQIDSANDSKKALNDLLSETTKNITTAAAAMDSMRSTIDKLKEATEGSTYTLNKYNSSMLETLELSRTGDIQSFSDSLKETIGYSEALFKDENFATSMDQEFAQKVAANQFKEMDMTMKTELSVLEQIEVNTRETMEKLDLKIEGLSTSISALSTTTESEPAAKEIVASAYNQALGRDPEAEGATHWENRLNSGTVLVGEIGQTMVSSAVAGGELTRREGITELYRGGFQREPDAGGLDYWTNSQLSINEIINRFQIADEQYTPFANGGIITKPTMGLIAEAGYSEAVIPLKNPNDPLGQKELIEQVKELIEKVEELQEINKNIAVSSNRTSIVMEDASFGRRPLKVEVA